MMDLAGFLAQLTLVWLVGLWGLCAARAGNWRRVAQIGLMFGGYACLLLLTIAERVLHAPVS